MNDKALIIFTRVPIPGQTKTRLMPFLTAQECVDLHTCFLNDILRKVGELDASLFLFYTPRDEKQLLLDVVGNQVICLPQYGQDLGQKMKNAIGSVLRLGYEKVLLMGSDIPQISKETIMTAFENLEHKDIVIHPTYDGGYYLIGMKQDYESIWKIERYGTNTVIYDTLQHMKNEHLNTAVGRKYYDVDEKEDLCRLYKDMKSGEIDNCPQTKAYLEKELAWKMEDCYE